MKLRKFFMFLFTCTAVVYLMYQIFPEQLSDLLIRDNAKTAVVEILSGNDGRDYVLFERNRKYGVRCVDHSGKLIYERFIPHVGSAENHVIRDVFVSSSGDIYASVYTYAEDLVAYVSLELYCFSDKLSQTICLNKTLLEPNESKYKILNNIKYFTPSEYDGCVYFPLLNDGEMQLLKHDSSDKKHLYLQNSMLVFEQINTAIALRGDKLLLGLSGGRAEIIDYDGKLTTLKNNDVIYSMFHQILEDYVVFSDAATDTLYLLDYMTGDSIRLDQSVFFMKHVTEYDLEQYVTFDINFENESVMVFNGTSKVASLSQDYRYEYDPMAVPYTPGELVLIALIVLGVLIFALMVNDFYFNYIRRRISFVTKQLIMYIVCVSVVMELLIVYVLKPDYTLMMYKTVTDRLITAANMFASQVKPDQDDYGVDIERTTAQMAKCGTDVVQIEFLLVEKVGDEYAIRSTSKYYENGVIMSSSEYVHDIMTFNELKTYDKDFYRSYLESDNVINGETTGKLIVVRRVPDNPNWIAVVKANKNKLISNINKLFEKVEAVLFATALLLLTLLFGTQFSFSRGLRRIMQGVDLIGQNHLDVQIVQNSGDELENLANSINGMTRIISSNIQAIESLNASYYRFVPKSLVRLFGESSAANLGKQSHVKKDMIVMDVSFGFDDERDTADTTSMFDNINEVIAGTSPIVYERKGTVYDFTCYSYTAVFEDDPENVLSTAVAIRQRVMALNDERKAEGRGGVDLRVAIDSGSVTMGIVGDENRMSATAVSDVMRLTQRLIKLSRKLDANILCTSNVMPENVRFASRCIGKLNEKDETIEVFEICDGDAYSLKNAKMSYQNEFARGMERFYSGDFKGAKQLLMDIVKSESRDGTAKDYLYQAYLYEEQPPKSITISGE